MWGDGGDFNGPDSNGGGISPVDDGSFGEGGGYFPGNGGCQGGSCGGGGQGDYFPEQGGQGMSIYLI